MAEFLTTAEAARAAGVTAHTLRRWEREGLIKPPARTVGGQRRWKPENLKPIGEVPTETSDRAANVNDAA